METMDAGRELKLKDLIMGEKEYMVNTMEG